VKRLVALAFVIALAAIAVGGIAGSLILHDGLSAAATPTRLEAFFAQHARALAIPANTRATKNPLQASAELLQDARRHFADHCAVCHGNDGDANTMLGRGMYPKPPDLRRPETQNLSDGEIFWIIEHGVRFTGMPAFSSHGGEQQDTWKLVLFIRHIASLSPAERMDMEQHNPKGPADREEEKDENNFLDAPAAGSKPAPDHQH
jgi:mono/diheme cytochrome c family protein